jgi:hypothetical protein
MHIFVCLQLHVLTVVEILIFCIREEFVRHGFGNIVTVAHKNVLLDGFGLTNVADAGTHTEYSLATHNMIICISRSFKMFNIHVAFSSLSYNRVFFRIPSDLNRRKRTGTSCQIEIHF